MSKEKRILSNSGLQVETRGEGDAKREVIVGCAIKYNTRSQLLGWFFEQIDERALDEADMSDVVALFNHDINQVLGRSTAGTLTLEKRSDGLYYVIDPPKSAANLLESIQRGDVRGSSFQFSVAPGGADWDMDPETGAEVRTVKKIKRLYDVSPVVFPAYLDTDTEVAKRAYEEYKQEQRESNRWEIEAAARKRKLRLNQI
ncbi:hypothetical protein CLV24_11419 [Pontibacter ummariensis]|uniref:Prohead serine protease domain-containing protein n=1 Tax=Pontibacter ummariensis TaxID=1610492 RepID=A0A239HJF3_9BACT|nr:HK97 family phage prohead protease [Pontibacter ummariensis]PRY10291.1 hypothetical protein CLV24_11419 [Pontibacter ummariensis]SNS81536.1 hypothetical protein SAMN06296052_11419 [Pontibacter ummariensis]